MGWLIGRLFTAAQALVTSRGVQIAGGTAAALDILNIDVFRREAVRISPTSDPEALEEAARAIHWMMGLSDGDIIGPRDVRNWNYFHYDPRKGRGWWTRAYTTKKAFGRGRRRGFGRGFRAGQRNIATISQAQRG